jgi:VanZ family protein
MTPSPTRPPAGRRRLDAASRFLPPLLLMGVIFYASAQPSLSSGLSWDFYLRKAAHMTEYGVLWLLWFRALRFQLPAGAVAAVAIVLAYAATDEYHQTFVTGRHGTPVDWLIDAGGMCVGIAAWALWRRRRRV